MTRARGNILFLILLAVVLFAALAYAVTSSMRGGGKNAKSENVEAKTATLMNYFALMDATLTRMTTTGGFKDYEINFFNASGPALINSNFSNAACTSTACRLMHPDGGGLPVIPMKPYGRDNQTPLTLLLKLPIPNVGTASDDIIFAIIRADMDVCKAVNQKFGVNDLLYSVGLNDSSTQLYMSAPPPAPFTDGGPSATNLPSAAALAGTWCSCQESNYAACESGQYRPTIYHVVFAR